jgi:hypothetical protein
MAIRLRYISDAVGEFEMSSLCFEAGGVCSGAGKQWNYLFPTDAMANDGSLGS